MIVIIDYGLGNTNSVKKAFYRIGIDSQISNDKNAIQRAEKLVLPGVGHFGVGMKNLKESGFLDQINDLVLKKKIPILGICLGMQLMTKHSEEANISGFDWIDAEVKNFKFSDNNLKIPHMGWNNLSLNKEDGIFKELSNKDMFYFVHSYYTICNCKSDITSSTEYGNYFVSSFQKDNIFGVQFHPEKSHDQGLRLLKNFAML